MLEAGDEMSKAVRRLSYEEFAARLREVLDSVAQEDGEVIVEDAGRSYSVTLTTKARALPPTPDPHLVRQILRDTAGGFDLADREQFLKELRDARDQDSAGRPAEWRS